MEIQLLRSKFVADTHDLDRGYRHAEQRANQYARNINRELESIGKVSGRSGGIFPGLANISEIIQGIPQVGRLIGGLVSPFTNAAEAGVKFNAWLETTTIGFETLLGSGERAKAMIASLQALSEKTPFQFQDLVSGTQKMLAFGFAYKDIIPTITAVGDAIASTGDISSEAVDGVLRALGQIKTKGRVQAEEMEQLAERGIPAWELLAKAIGKTVGETRKLAELGKLKGPEAVDAIAAMMRGRYGGQMERLSGTLTGRLSNLEDIQARAQGVAAQNLTLDLSEMVDAALKKGDLATTLATGINSAIAPVSGLIKGSVKVVLGGGITSGLTEAMQAAESVMPGVVQQMLEKGVLAPAKEALGIHSPSRVFYGYGFLSAQGFALGLQDGLEGTMQTDKRTVQRNLDKLGQEFKDKVKQIAEQLKTNPDWLLNAMAFETGGSFSPKAHNPTSGATGLIQFLPSTARGLGTSTDQLAGMTALKQLDYVFSYLKSFAGKLNSQSDVYSAIFSPANVGAPDETAMYRKGTIAYRDNSGLDLDRSGVIDKGEAAARVGTMGFGNVSRQNPLPISIIDNTVTFEGNIGGGSDVSFGELPELTEEVSSHFKDVAVTLREIQPLIPIDATNRLGDAALAAAQGFDQAGNSAGTWADKVIAATNVAEERFKSVTEDLRSGFDDAFGSGLIDLMQGKGKNAGLNFLLGFTNTIEQNLAKSISQRLGDVVFGEDGSGGVLGGVFSKIFGKVLGVKKEADPAVAALANHAVHIDANIAALDRNTAAHAGGGAGSLSGLSDFFGGASLHNKISDLQSKFLGRDGPVSTEGADLSGLSLSISDPITDTTERSGEGIEAAVANAGNLTDSIIQNFQGTVERLLTPNQPSFWAGLLGAVLNSVASGLGSAVTGALSGDGGEGGGGPAGGSSVGVRDEDGNYLDSGSPTEHRASGGPVKAGEMYEVNEYGTEHFKPYMDGEIIPLGKTNEQQKGGDTHYHINVSVPMKPASSYNQQKSNRELAEQTMRLLPA
jgi:tape measure domain-containing protein